jgi:hypothetical protein
MKRPSMKQAVLAKCHNCCGGYADGHKDCMSNQCSLYYWMPYRGHNEPGMEWTKYNPLRTGTVEKTKLELTDEQREKLKERIAKMHSARNARSMAGETSNNEPE